MIEVLNPGTYSSIQDDGRKGYRHYGVPVGGFMDALSAHTANVLLGKATGSALIEIGLSGLVLRFYKPTSIVVCGAQAHLTLNGNRIENNRLTKVEEFDVLQFGTTTKGVWSYLGINGLFLSQNIMGSYSQFSSVTTSSRLKKGDCIEFSTFSTMNKSYARTRLKSKTIENSSLNVFKGPEYDLMPLTCQEQLFNTVHFLSAQCNRMAYKLQTVMESHSHSILSNPVLPGTLQWTPSGEVFCLMKDAQTSGGYPRVLQLSEESLGVLAQKRPDEGFKFQLF